MCDIIVERRAGKWQLICCHNGIKSHQHRCSVNMCSESTGHWGGLLQPPPRWACLFDIQAGTNPLLWINLTRWEGWKRLEGILVKNMPCSIRLKPRRDFFFHNSTPQRDTLIKREKHTTECCEYNRHHVLSEGKIQQELWLKIVL